jgi:hypothetical protein
MTAYGAAILVGASSSNRYQKIVTVSGFIKKNQNISILFVNSFHQYAKQTRWLDMACLLLLFGREHETLTSQIRLVSHHFTCSFGRYVNFSS